MTTPNFNPEAPQLLADGLALVYHEARHVRHLIEWQHLTATGWEKFSSLASNRVKAWLAIQQVRSEAAQSIHSDNATQLFNDRFQKNLNQLLELYKNPNWKHASAVGGHAWRNVTMAVADLAQEIDTGSTEGLNAAAEKLVNSRHNNGFLRDKIRDLDQAIGRTVLSAWWSSD